MFPGAALPADEAFQVYGVIRALDSRAAALCTASKRR